jgi:ferredoxin-NADP reductase
MEALRLLVRDLRWEGEDMLSLGLTDPRGGQLPAWVPGAHIDVRLTPGIERQYTLCSDPADRRSGGSPCCASRTGRVDHVTCTSNCAPAT